MWSRLKKFKELSDRIQDEVIIAMPVTELQKWREELTVELKEQMEKTEEMIKKAAEAAARMGPPGAPQQVPVE